MVDEERLEVEDLSMENKNFRCFEDVITQRDGKHQAKRAIKCEEGLSKDFRTYQQHYATCRQCHAEYKVGRAEKRQKNKRFSFENICGYGDEEAERL